jgi:hypothetical protein
MLNARAFANKLGDLQGKAFRVLHYLYDTQKDKAEPAPKLVAAKVSRRKAVAQ